MQNPFRHDLERSKTHAFEFGSQAPEWQKLSELEQHADLNCLCVCVCVHVWLSFLDESWTVEVLPRFFFFLDSILDSLV